MATHVRSVGCWGEVVWSGEYARLGMWALEAYSTFKVRFISLLRPLSLSFYQRGSLIELWLSASRSIDSLEMKNPVSSPTASSAESPTNYGMCVFSLVLSFHPRPLLKYMLSLTSSIHFHVNLCSASRSTKYSSSLRAQTTNSTCSRPPARMSRSGSKMGYHSHRAECLHGDTRRRLLRSRAAVCPSPVPHYPSLDSLT